MCRELFNNTERDPHYDSSPTELISVEAEFRTWMETRQFTPPESIPTFWESYVQQLRSAARALLITQTMGGRDQDNVAFEAADAMLKGAVRQETENIDHESDLWKILLIRAAGKIAQQQPQDKPSSLATILADIPSPRVCIHFVEELESVVRSRLDARLRRVAFLRLEGCPNGEIAQRLGQQEAEIEPQLNEIRQRLSATNV